MHGCMHPLLVLIPCHTGATEGPSPAQVEAWSDMPFGMGGYVQSVVVQGRVYVGGGHGDYGSDDNYIVMHGIRVVSVQGKWCCHHTGRVNLQ